MSLRNDLGLLSEEYDPVAGRLVGNFPQAFSHVSLVNTASKLTGQEKPTVDHVVLGLAREAMARGKASMAGGSLRGDAARTMLKRLQLPAGARSGDGSPVSDAAAAATEDEVLGEQGGSRGTVTRWRVRSAGSGRPGLLPSRRPVVPRWTIRNWTALPTRSKKKAAAYRAATVAGDGSGGSSTRAGRNGRRRVRRRAGRRQPPRRLEEPIATDADVARAGDGRRRSVPARPRRRVLGPDGPQIHSLRSRRRVELRCGGNVADGVIEIDTLLGGWQRVTAGYLIEGSAPLLVETGSQSSVPVLLDQLDRLGLAAEDLAGVVVTHIHLDHAGGVGDVARAFPKATVYVHEKGARHLVDPTRLVDSAARVYGPLLDSLYGRLDPTPTERIHVLADGEEIPVGSSRSLVAVDSPGHAKHHVALHDSAERRPLRRRRGGREAARRRGPAPLDTAAGLRSRPRPPLAPSASPSAGPRRSRSPTTDCSTIRSRSSRGRRDAAAVGGGGRGRLPERGGHRSHSRRRVRVRHGRRRSRASPEARGDERRPFERCRAAALARRPVRSAAGGSTPETN